MRFFIFCLSCLLFSGCAVLPSAVDEGAEIAESLPEPALPVPAQFPVSPQFRLEAGRHWQSIAQDSARALVSRMRGLRCGPGMDCRMLYVVAPEVETDFSRAFTNALITALVTQNIAVSSAPDSALMLHIDVQSLKFGYGDKAEADQRVRSLMPNLWASTTRETTPGNILFSSRAAHSEIFVTLSVLDGARYAARNSEVYYVSADDLRLYEQRICSRLNPCEGGITDANPLPPKKGEISIVGKPGGGQKTEKVEK